MFKVTHLRVNHKNNRFIGADDFVEFSWRLVSDEKNVVQTAYRIIVSANGNTVWDSGKINGDEQSFVPYCGDDFDEKTEYTAEVTAWDNKGNKATASVIFETAYKKNRLWEAKWAESPFERNSVPYFTYGVENPVVSFTKTFSSDKKVKKARLYATCYGVYRPLINGKRIDDCEFAPEFTPYDKILNYQCYDVTEFIKNGDNTLELLVGDGWYFCGQTEVVTADRKKKPSVLFALDVCFDDGTIKSVLSDKEVLCRKTNTSFSDIFMGEKTDMTAPFGKEENAEEKEYDYKILRCQPIDGIIAAEEISAKRVFISPKGETIVDFGQVIAGRTRVIIKEPKGRELKFEHSEVLDAEDNYFTALVAKQCDTVIADGTEFIFEPKFTFHGFRYVRVSGMNNPTPGRFTAVLLTSEKEDISSFSCEDERFNRLYKNIRYSQKNNMMSVPTDCPTREKAGWTGDIAMYALAAATNDDMSAFLSCWLDGLRADQLPDGVVPIVSPYTNMYDMVARKTMSDFKEEKRIDGLDEIVGENSFLSCGSNPATGVAGWSDAIVFVPYALYKTTGNKSIISENYAAMKKWCDWIIREAREKKGTNLPDETDKYLWDTGFQFGEWLVPGRTGEGFEICKESALYISSFFGYKTLTMFSELGKVIGDESAEFYSDYAKKMKSAIQNGLFANDMLPRHLMGAYVLAFAFDLVDDIHREEYKQRLISLVEEHGYCLQTGFLATPFLMDALEKIGRKDLAKAILYQTKSPSWLYEVEKGATSMWESWTAMDENGNPEKVSFDHYAFGVIDEWFRRRVCGIDFIEAGFKKIKIAPDTYYGFEKFSRTLVAEAGEIKVARNRDTLSVSIPVNTTATVEWQGKTYEIGSGDYVLGGNE